MALSGSVSTNTGMDGRYYQLSWTATQSIANNTSTISWTLKAVGAGTMWEAERTVYVNIDGASVYSKTDYVERYAGTVKTGTTTISHNSDGTKSFTVSLGAAVYYSNVTCTGSATFTLDTIARASGLSVSNGTLGTAQTITADRKSSSFTHTLQWSCGSYSGTIATKSTATSWSFTPALKLANGAPNGTSVYCTFTLTTYNGTTLIGSVSKSVWHTIPTSVKPSVSSVAISDGNGYADTYGGYIQGQSTLHIVVTAAGAYSSTIKSYSTSANGSTYTSSDFTTGALKSSGSMRIKTTVTDSRGRTATKTSSVTILPYSVPKITSLMVHRCDSDGTENDRGTYAKVSFVYSVTSLSDQNQNTAVLKYKKSSNTTWSTAKISPTSYNMDSSVIIPADDAYSYDILLAVTDSFTTSSVQTTVSTGYCLYHIPATGRGITFGGVAESDGFNVKMDSTFENPLTAKADATFEESVEVKKWLYMGGYSGTSAEKQILFKSAESGDTYPHNIKIYGGKGSSTIALGVYDAQNSRSVVRYYDNDNAIKVYPGTHFAGGLTEDIKVLVSGNCNTLLTSGNYYIGTSGTNKPGSGENGWLTVKAYDSGSYCYQEYVTYTGKIYYRMRENGTWQPWIITGGGCATYTDTQTPWTSTNSSNTETRTYRRIGNVVWLHYNATYNPGAESQDETLFTIPDGYKPAYVVMVSYTLVVNATAVGYGRWRGNTNGSSSIIVSTARLAEHKFTTSWITNDDFPT